MASNRIVKEFVKAKVFEGVFSNSFNKMHKFVRYVVRLLLYEHSKIGCSDLPVK